MLWRQDTQEILRRVDWRGLQTELVSGHYQEDWTLVEDSKGGGLSGETVEW